MSHDPVLVTGSAGFIGFHLAKRLLDEGHFVVGFDGMTRSYDVSLKEKRHAIHAAAGDAAEATAERAGVLIAGPLALCFLPAFVVLGLLPTIAGLAESMLGPLVAGSA